jgi:hypothetical protein
LKDLCFCLQLGDSRLSLALPHSLKDGVELVVQVIESFCGDISHVKVAKLKPGITDMPS